jgi:hypothetical protein
VAAFPEDAQRADYRAAVVDAKILDKPALKARKSPSSICAASMPLIPRFACFACCGACGAAPASTAIRWRSSR